MQGNLIKVGRQIVNLSAVTDAKWDSGKLYLHFNGTTSFQRFEGDAAEKIWMLLDRRSLDLDTGEAPQE